MLNNESIETKIAATAKNKEWLLTFQSISTITIPIQRLPFVT